MSAAAIASGATRTAAKRAGLKAGFKRGAIAEGVASGVVEGVADQGIQRRNVELGLQDEVSYLQTGAAIGIGTATGGVLGGFFGTAGAVNPLRPGGKSKIAEGMLEGAQARPNSSNITSGEAKHGQTQRRALLQTTSQSFGSQVKRRQTWHLR